MGSPIYKNCMIMAAAFSKILIPVDFSVSTEIAVRKAIGFIEPENAFIQLLHVIKPPVLRKLFSWGPAACGSRLPVSGKYALREAENKLEEWKSLIRENLPGVPVKSSILNGASVQQMIVQSARMLSPDLIIIGRQGNRRRWPFFHAVSPDYIARQSNCPVLTVKPGSIHHKTKLIVMPVRNAVPERELELAVMIAKKYRAQVHLVAIQESPKIQGGDPSQAFIQTYHRLREKLHHPVEYFSVTRHNPVKATLDYAEFVMADMILMNPETGSGLSSFTGSRHISDLLARDSKIQILDVLPY